MNTGREGSADPGGISGRDGEAQPRCLLVTTCGTAAAASDTDHTGHHATGRCGGSAHPGSTGCRSIALLRGGRFDGQDVFVSAAEWSSGVYTHAGKCYRAVPSRTSDGLRVFALQTDPAAT